MKVLLYHFLPFFSLLICAISFAQNIKIVQDNDDVLIFNETSQTTEVWIALDDKVINEIVSPGIMKRYVNDGFLTKATVNESHVYHAYTYKVLIHDVRKSLDQFYAQLQDNRQMLNRGYKLINQPFYQLSTFKEFLDTETQRSTISQIHSDQLKSFIAKHIIPQNRNLLSPINHNELGQENELTEIMSQFLTMQVIDEREKNMFIDQMNRLLTYFDNYSENTNTLSDLGTLVDNGFKVFERKGNPGTNFGVYLTTNNLKLIKNYDYRVMDTRGLNFEVEFSQRLYVARIAKRRTLNLYGATSYLSLKDKEFDLKKSFINVGPQIRYAGFYENQVELVAEAGAIIDITADKYMAATDEKQFGYYYGGQLSLLFFRFGMRYYDQLTEPELAPEGQWFYRLGLVAKF